MQKHPVGKNTWETYSTYWKLLTGGRGADECYSGYDANLTHQTGIHRQSHFQVRWQPLTVPHSVTLNRYAVSLRATSTCADHVTWSHLHSVNATVHTHHSWRVNTA